MSSAVADLRRSTRLRGSRLPIRVLEDDLHAPAQRRAARRGSSAGRSAPSKRDAPGGRLDQAQQQRGRSCSCPSRTRRPGRAPRRGDLEARRRRPRARAAASRRATAARARPAKCVTSRFATASERRVTARSSAGSGCRCAGADVDERRRSRLAGGSAQRAARREARSPAAARAGCGTLPGMAAARRAASAVAARARQASSAARVGMHAGARRSSRHAPSSTIWPAYITTTRSAISATTPRLWVMNSIAMPRARAAAGAAARGSAPGW